MSPANMESVHGWPTPAPAPEGLLLNHQMRMTSPRYGDRMIPTRVGNTWNLTYPSSRDKLSSDLSSTAKKVRVNKSDGAALYSNLLLNEVLGSRSGSQHENVPMKGHRDMKNSRKLFHYDTHERTLLRNDRGPLYSMSPISPHSEAMLLRHRKPSLRKISEDPYKALDATNMTDDFYLNLVDWSHDNLVCAGLGSRVFIHSIPSKTTTHLCDLSQSYDTVTSVAWKEKGSMLAVGTISGQIHLWDTAVGKQVTTYPDHPARVGVMAWNGNLLTSGCRAGIIIHKDIRESPAHTVRQVVHAHAGEVCGLKWSPDKELLASGGDDNILRIWNLNSAVDQPLQMYNDHTGAIRAITWSPHRHGLLASGGGTRDRQVRFRDTLVRTVLGGINTGAQVCNLGWSKHSDELVSTHGYSSPRSSNCKVVVFKYPSSKQVKILYGHTCRVLQFAMSPDGESIITGAGGLDETLRFWKVFEKNRSKHPSSIDLCRRLV